MEKILEEQCHTPKGISSIQLQNKRDVPPSPHSPTTCRHYLDCLKTELDECVQFRIDEENAKEQVGALQEAQAVIASLRIERDKIEARLQQECDLGERTKRDSELKCFRLEKDLENKNLEIVQLREQNEDLKSREKLCKSRYSREVESLSHALSVAQTKISTSFSIPEETNQDEKVDELETQVQNLREEVRLHCETEAILKQELESASYLLAVHTKRAEQYSALNEDLLANFNELSETVSALIEDLQAWEISREIPDSMDFPLPTAVDITQITDLLKNPLPSFPVDHIVLPPFEDIVAWYIDTIKDVVSPWNSEIETMLLDLKSQVGRSLEINDDISSVSNEIFSFAMLLRNTATLIGDTEQINNEMNALLLEKESMLLQINLWKEKAQQADDSLLIMRNKLENLEHEMELYTRKKDCLLQINSPLNLKMSRSFIDPEISTVSVKVENQEFEDVEVKTEPPRLQISGMTTFLSANSSVNDQSTFGLTIDNVCSIPKSNELMDFAAKFSEYLVANEVLHPDDVPPSDPSVFNFFLERYLDLVYAYNTARDQILALEEQDVATKTILSHLNSQLIDDSNITNSTDGDFGNSTICGIKNEISLSTTAIDEMTHDPLELTMERFSTPSQVKTMETTPFRRTFLRREPVSSVKKTVSFRSPLLAQRINLDAENSRLKQLLDERAACCTSLEQIIESQKLEILGIKESLEDLKAANKMYLDELANLEQRYATEKEEMQKELEESIDQSTIFREKLYRETIDLDPSLNEFLLKAPLSEVLAKFIQTIMTRCQSVQEEQKATFDEDKNEWASARLDFMTHNQGLKETIRDLNFQLENLSALLAIANEEKLKLEAKLITLEEHVAKLSHDKNESDKSRQEMESELKALKDVVDNKNAEISKYATMVGDIERFQTLLNSKETEYEKVHSELEMQITALKDVISQRDKDISEHVLRVESIKNEVASCHDVSNEKENALKQAILEKATYKLKLSENVQDHSQDAQISGKEESLRKEIEMLHAQIDALSNDLEVSRVQSTKAEEMFLSEKSNLEESLKESTAEILLLRKQLDEVIVLSNDMLVKQEAAQGERQCLLQEKKAVAEKLNGLLQEKGETLETLVLKNIELDDAVSAHRRALLQLIPELENKNEENSKLKSVLDGLRRETTELNQSREALEGSLAEASVRLSSLQVEVADLTKRNASLEIENSALNSAAREKGDSDSLIREKDTLLEKLRLEYNELKTRAQNERSEAAQQAFKLEAEVAKNKSSIDLLEDELKSAKKEQLRQQEENGHFENIRSKVRDLELAIIEKDETISKHMLRIEEQMNELQCLQKVIDDRNGEVHVLHIKLKTLESEIDALQKSRATTQEERDEFKLLLNIQDHEFKSLQREKGKLESDLNEVSEKLTAAENLLQAAETRNSDFAAELELIKDELLSTKAIIGKLNKEVEELVSSRDAFKSTNEQLQKELEVFQFEKCELEGTVDNLKNFELASSKAKIDNLNKEVLELISSRDLFKFSNEKLQKEVADAHSKQLELEELINKYENVEILTSKAKIQKLSAEIEELVNSRLSYQNANDQLKQDLKSADLKRYELEVLVEGYKSTEAAILRKLEEKQKSDELITTLTLKVTNLKDLVEVSNNETAELRRKLSEKDSELRTLNQEILEKLKLLNTAESKLSLASQENTKLEEVVKKLTSDNGQLQVSLKDRQEESSDTNQKMSGLQDRVENLRKKICVKEEENLELKRLLIIKENAISDLHDKVKDCNEINTEMLELLAEIQAILGLPKEALLGITRTQDDKSYLRFVKNRNDENIVVIKSLQKENRTFKEQNELLTLEIKNQRIESLARNVKVEELEAFGKSQETKITELESKLNGLGKPRRSDIGARRMDKLEVLNDELVNLLTQVLTNINLPDCHKLNLISLRSVERASKAILEYAKMVGDNFKEIETFKSRMDELDAENEELSKNVTEILEEKNTLELELLQHKTRQLAECDGCTKLNLALEDSRLALVQLEENKQTLTQKVNDLEEQCKKLRAELEEKGDELIRATCASNPANQLCLRGSNFGGMAQEAGLQEQLRQLNKKCDMYKELLRSRSQNIKELEAKLLISKAPMNSNRMDSPIREQSYNARTRGDVAAAYKKAVRQKAIGIENA